MHFLHPDHFPVTQIEVKIYFWFIWVAFEQQKWQKKESKQKDEFLTLRLKCTQDSEQCYKVTKLELGQVLEFKSIAKKDC